MEDFKKACDFDFDFDRDRCGCAKCKKLEKVSEELVREAAELNRGVVEKIEAAKAIEKEIEELERKVEALRKKQKAIIAEGLSLGALLEKTAYEAVKYLFAAIECYKKCKENDHHSCQCCCRCKCRREDHC